MKHAKYSLGMKIDADHTVISPCCIRSSLPCTSTLCLRHWQYINSPSPPWPRLRDLSRYDPGCPSSARECTGMLNKKPTCAVIGLERGHSSGQSERHPSYRGKGFFCFSRGVDNVRLKFSFGLSRVYCPLYVGQLNLVSLG